LPPASLFADAPKPKTPISSAEHHNATPVPHNDTAIVRTTPLSRDRTAISQMDTKDPAHNQGLVGRSSRLLGLPRQLRDLLYRFLFTSIKFLHGDGPRAERKGLALPPDLPTDQGRSGRFMAGPGHIWLFLLLMACLTR